MMSLLQIQTFLEVAHAGSFVGASDRLNLPRSTVSARVRALEERLGVQLFRRTTRKTLLTDEGRSFRDSCTDALDMIRAAEARVRGAGELQGAIRMTIPIDMPKQSIAGLVASFCDLHTSVSVEVIVTDETLDLERHGIDIALRGGKPGAPSLISRRVGEGDWACFASPTVGSPKRAAAAATPLPIVDPAGRCKAAPRARLATRNFELAKAWALVGTARAILPVGLCAREEADGTLVRTDLAEAIEPLPLFLVLPPVAYRPRRVRAFIDYLTASGALGSLT